MYLGLFRLSVDSVEFFWVDRVSTFLSGLPVNELNLSEAELEMVSNQVHVWSILLVQFFLINSLLLSRWYQSKLYNPGGFSREFLSFKLPKSLAILLMFFLFLNASELLGTGKFSVLSDISLVLMGLFFFPWSLCHSLHWKRKQASQRLVYGFIFFDFIVAANCWFSHNNYRYYRLFYKFEEPYNQLKNKFTVVHRFVYY